MPLLWFGMGKSCVTVTKVLMKLRCIISAVSPVSTKPIILPKGEVKKRDMLCRRQSNTFKNDILNLMTIILRIAVRES